MKSFKTYLNEQILKSEENTLDPEFLEKKSKKDTIVVKDIKSKIEGVNKDLKQAEEIKV